MDTSEAVASEVEVFARADLRAVQASVADLWAAHTDLDLQSGLATEPGGSVACDLGWVTGRGSDTDPDMHGVSDQDTVTLATHLGWVMAWDTLDTLTMTTRMMAITSPSRRSQTTPLRTACSDSALTIRLRKPILAMMATDILARSWKKRVSNP